MIDFNTYIRQLKISMSGVRLIKKDVLNTRFLIKYKIEFSYFV